MVTALRTAFDAILAASSDQARAKALRAGLKCLLSEDLSANAARAPKRSAKINGSAEPVAASAAPRRSRTARKASGRPRGRPPKPKPSFRDPVVNPPSELVAAPLTEPEIAQLRFLRDAGAATPGCPLELIEKALSGAELVPVHLSRVRAVLVAS